LHSNRTSKTPANSQTEASLTFAQITNRDQARWFSGYEELDRVLGGGIVPGSLVLIGVIRNWQINAAAQVSNRLAQQYHPLCMWGRIRSASEAELLAWGLLMLRIRTRCSLSSRCNGASPAAQPTAEKVLVLTFMCCQKLI